MIKRALWSSGLVITFMCAAQSLSGVPNLQAMNKCITQWRSLSMNERQAIRQLASETDQVIATMLGKATMLMAQAMHLQKNPIDVSDEYELEAVERLLHVMRPLVDLADELCSVMEGQCRVVRTLSPEGYAVVRSMTALLQVDINQDQLRSNPHMSLLPAIAEIRSCLQSLIEQMDRSA